MGVSGATYNALISACAKKGEVDRAEFWLKRMLKSSTQADVASYSSVIHACAKANDLQRAEAWIEQMERDGVQANVVTYNSAINACARCGDVKRAEHWFHKMVKQGIQPGVLTFNSMVNACLPQNGTRLDPPGPAMIVTRVTPEQPQKSLRALASTGTPRKAGGPKMPGDWAEMELATNKLAEELWRAREAQQPYDGVLGFSQGAEMVHTLALLKHAEDVRFAQDGVFPRFLVSLSGAVNPGHFEWPSGNGPPPEVQGPTFGPQRGTMMTPCLFVGDYHSDNWYPSSRFSGTQDLYADKLVVPHAQRHAVPQLDPQAVSQVQRFLLRFARR
ncbi:unnamed protein product [Effrenium voratum]|nr:unnamed protein product [Effrenium voratum]